METKKSRKMLIPPQVSKINKVLIVRQHLDKDTTHKFHVQKCICLRKLRMHVYAFF